MKSHMTLNGRFVPQMYHRCRDALQNPMWDHNPVMDFLYSRFFIRLHNRTNFTQGIRNEIPDQKIA
jgi:hypothetical protein